MYIKDDIFHTYELVEFNIIEDLTSKKAVNAKNVNHRNAIKRFFSFI